MSLKEKLISILPFISVSIFVSAIVLFVLSNIYHNGFMTYLALWFFFQGIEPFAIYDLHNLSNNMHSSDIKKQLAARAEAEEWSNVWLYILVLGFFFNLFYLLLFSNISAYIEQLIAGLLLLIYFFTFIVVLGYSISIMPKPEKPKDPEKLMNAAS